MEDYRRSISRMQFSQVDALNTTVKVACVLRNNHTPSTAYERCPNQLPTGSGTPLVKKKKKRGIL